MEIECIFRMNKKLCVFFGRETSNVLRAWQKINYFPKEFSITCVFSVHTKCKLKVAVKILH